MAERLDAQLDEATRMFLANHGKGLVLVPDGRTAEVFSIFKWFREDFSGTIGA